MLHHLGSGKAVWSEWHERREQARRTAHSVDEFSEVEKTKYDLDTAGITGEDNPETYEGEQVQPEPFLDPHDARDLPWV